MNMKLNKRIYLASSLALVLPVVSFAALDSLRTLLVDFGGLINFGIRIVFGLAMAFFFWGGAQFILNDAASDKTREDGKKKMLWGVIALFVMFSIYGILMAIGNLIGISPNGTSSSSGLYTPQQGGYTLPTFGN
ncbi:MAG: hypothetical protein AB201_02425 [Parcubacteria bacterium C7867-006]|nr:MAG: hypothetical protein AB201_02425 [Parcubacteria bacterium C7867-006]